jgi:hypothetical protein
MSSSISTMGTSNVVGKESMDQALAQLEGIPDLVLDVEGTKILGVAKERCVISSLYEASISEIYR